MSVEAPLLLAQAHAQDKAELLRQLDQAVHAGSLRYRLGQLQGVGRAVPMHNQLREQHKLSLLSSSPLTPMGDAVEDARADLESHSCSLPPRVSFAYLCNYERQIGRVSLWCSS